MTYKERALRALMQKGAKSPIHKRAFRARVKEQAQSRGEPLGPAWQKWADKALEQLHEEGIAELSASFSGGVALTPKGKRMLSNVKSNLGITWDPSPRESDEITREVIKGTKRSHASLSLDHNSPTKKRPRRSSRQTKAQLLDSLDESNARIEDLQARIANLEKTEQRVHPFLRGVSPLTDIGEDDDDGIEIDADQTLQDDSSQLEPASSPIIPPSIAFSVAQVPTTPAPRRLVPTKSGSFIYRISKQPTPAPSSAGSDIGDDNDTFHDCMMDDDAPTPPRAATPRFEGGLATPESTPSRPGSSSNVYQASTFGTSMQTRGPDLREELDKCEALLSQARAREVENLQEIGSLSAQLNARSAELDRLQTSSNSNHAEKDAHILALEAQLAYLTAQVARLTASETALLRRRRELEAEVDELEARLADSAEKVSRLETNLEEAWNLVTALEAQGQGKAVDLENLRQQLEAEQNLAKIQSSDLEAAQRELKEMQEMTEAGEMLLNTENDDLRNQLFLAEIDVETKAQQAADAQERIRVLEAEVGVKNAELAQLRSQAQRTSDEKEAICAELANTKAQYESQVSQYDSTIASLRDELSASQTEAANLQTSLSSSEVRIEKLQAELAAKSAEYRGEISRLSNQLDERNSELAESQKEVVGLRQDLEGVENDYDELSQQTNEHLSTITHLKFQVEDQAKRILSQVEGINTPESVPRRARKTARTTV
ncbi:hypothetical protein VKT23_013391 [Stygiomarasmius scandens]|uniref:Uncharacterized protein n=1 Tax=Marasmiellus scandens TaxID=2682957 RepID=A0ABR1J3A7_9AGAR